MKVGFSKIEITPAIGTGLAGYACKRTSDGIMYPLYVKALVLEFYGKRNVWFTYDLIAVDDLLLDKLNHYFKEYDLLFEDVELFATHTHSGPVGTCDTGFGKLRSMISVFGEKNDAYLDLLAKQSAIAAADAIANLADCEMEMHSGKLNDFAASRHDVLVSIPNDLIAVTFKRRNEEPILLYHFAAHPTILHQDNLKISSDFVGGIEAALQDQYPNNLFINGSCGNISTRFTRKESSKKELERLANHASRQILDLLEEPVTHNDNLTYFVDRFEYKMKKKEMDSLEVASSKIESFEKQLEEAIKEQQSPQAIRVLESYCEGARANYSLVKDDDGSEFQTINVSIIKIGKLKIVGIPAELFSSLASMIDTKDTMIANYANGYFSYIADIDAYDHNYYEALSSYYERGEGEKLVQFINEKLKKL